MSIPFFYCEDIETASAQYVLNEENSKHVAQVLRMQPGERLQLTDGQGNLYTASLSDSNKKRSVVGIIEKTSLPSPKRKIRMAVSPLKNMHRFEWFLEKATEIGITEMVPLLCSRTEKQHIRADRLKAILVSAMLQSQQCWLPLLHEPTRYTAFVKDAANHQPSTKKFIAHCLADEPREALPGQHPFDDAIIMIGPEGDFTIDEVELALQYDFLPVSLGDTRLRSETAAIVAVTILSR